MMLGAVISSTQAPHAQAATAVAGVLVGLVWLTALGLATTAGWIWLRDRTLPSPPPNLWTIRAAWTRAVGFIATTGVLATGAAS
jgi:hypothetical protein